MREPVGLIGLGLLGSALALRLSAAGFAVVGCDIDPAKSAAGERVASAREVAARCRRIVVCVLTAEQSAQALASMGDALAPGALVVDTTTGDPDAMAALGEALAARGVGYVDAAIGGGSTQVRAGDALVLAGGRDADLAAAADLLDAFGREVRRMGGPGDGARAKLVFNLVLGLHRAALAEGLGLARALGLDLPATLEALMAGAARSAAMEAKGAKMLARDFAPQARLDQHLKDVLTIRAAARTHGARTPLSDTHADLLRALADAGHGGLDNSAVLLAYDPDGDTPSTVGGVLDAM